jgi:hypothetical protein
MDFRRARTRTVFPSAVNGNMFASLKVDLERQVISRWLPTGVRPRNDRLQYIQDIQQLALNVAVGSTPAVK